MAPRKGHKMTNVSKPVKEFLERYPGEGVSLHRIMNATGFSEDQIRSALSHARQKGYPLETVKRGSMWRYIGEQTENDVAEFVATVETVPAAECTPVEPEFDDEKGFYQISTSVEGNPILQKDSDGTFWLAKRI